MKQSTDGMEVENAGSVGSNSALSDDGGWNPIVPV